MPREKHVLKLFSNHLVPAYQLTDTPQLIRHAANKANSTFIPHSSINIAQTALQIDP